MIKANLGYKREFWDELDYTARSYIKETNVWVEEEEEGEKKGEAKMEKKKMESID